MLRRDFIKQTAFASTALLLPSYRPVESSKIVISLQLLGGNDGLNTLIPYRNDDYYRARPKINIAANKTLRLDETFGLHPALTAFQTLYDQGYLSIFNQVGYPDMLDTHFGASEVWRTASSDPTQEKHWLEQQASFCDLDDVLSGNFEQQLQYIITQIKANKPITAYHFSLEGFDTHQQQCAQHHQALQRLSNGIDYCMEALQKLGRSQDVEILIYSEFGRSIAENQQLGTEHGAANTLFIIGTERPEAGIYNSIDLTQKTSNGGLAHQLDFRAIYERLVPVQI